MRTLLAIPCYRCEKQIVRLLQNLKNSPVFARISKVIVIDNQSPDGTRNAVIRFIQSNLNTPKICLSVNERNYGLGGSQKVAIDRAIDEKFDVLAVLHGDDQACVDDLTALLEALDRDPELCGALGSRFMPGSSLKGYQRSRIFGNRVLNFVFTAVTGRRTRDLGSGLNAFRVRALERIPFARLNNGFIFNVDLLLEFYSAGLKVLFLPIQWTEVDQVSNARNWNVALGMLKQLFLWRFRLPRFGSDQGRVSKRVEI